MNRRTIRDSASYVKRVQSCLSSDFNKVTSPGLVSKSSLGYRQQDLLEVSFVSARLNSLLALFLGCV